MVGQLDIEPEVRGSNPSPANSIFNCSSVSTQPKGVARSLKACHGASEEPGGAFVAGEAQTRSNKDNTVE
ncbi:hypothetical protein PoB_007617300 [Plakobranchus ocellatus]|uniref:Uncharacterized protein n=1 Tax=Plakobranchus ocellatus TaxID=259542 RepID=A0AAV4DZH2_9GAST|nr:hypothetical protein PoB_007617300 [Plakobranchus ocellatus]